MSFYIGGLLGLQKQLALNLVAISVSAVGSGGAVLIFWRVSPTITAFFTWQIFIGAGHIMIITLLMWRGLSPFLLAPHLYPRPVSNVWRFPGGSEGAGVS